MIERMSSPSGDEANQGHLTPARPAALESSLEAEDVTESAIPLPAPGPTSDDLPTGSQVGEYVVTGRLGRGGMGSVFGALHPLIGKKAAVKVISGALSSDGAAVQRFVEEARAVNRIGHPNIVDVFSFGTLPDGRSYFVMEYLVGQTLGGRMRKGPFTQENAFSILDQIADALEAAHEKGVVHRDLKPDNVFLSEPRAGRQRVKLLDFGIAKLVAQEGSRGLTQTGFVMGSPGYVSPEQARGKPIDGRSDVYALGALAFEMISGCAPFVADNTVDLVVMHCTQPAPSLMALVPDLPPAIGELVQQMLAKKPEQRPALEALRRALADAVDLGVAEPTPMPGPRLQTPPAGAPAVTGYVGMRGAAPGAPRAAPTGSRPEVSERAWADARGSNVGVSPRAATAKPEPGTPLARARTAPPVRSGTAPPAWADGSSIRHDAAYRPEGVAPTVAASMGLAPTVAAPISVAPDDAALASLGMNRGRLALILGAAIAIVAATAIAIRYRQHEAPAGRITSTEATPVVPPAAATTPAPVPTPVPTRVPRAVTAVPPASATAPPVAPVAPGRLVLDLDGESARLRIDGRPAEKVTRNASIQLPPGRHALELVFADRTVRRQIDVRSKQVTSVTIDAPRKRRPARRTTGSTPDAPKDRSYTLDPFAPPR